MQLTRILDTLYDADRSLANGRMVISCPAFQASDGTAVAGSIITKQIVSGAIDFFLAPTQGSNPATTYQVEYFLANAGQYTETWTVPLTGPITISQARETA